MGNKVPTLQYAPANRQNITAARLFSWGAILSLVSLFIAGLLPSRRGGGPTAWDRIGLYSMTICFGAGLALGIAGVIHTIVVRRSTRLAAKSNAGDNNVH